MINKQDMDKFNINNRIMIKMDNTTEKINI